MSDDVYCPDCGKSCEVEQDYIEYNGTHCTSGESGRHYLDEYYSKCCFAEIEIEVKE